MPVPVAHLASGQGTLPVARHLGVLRPSSYPPERALRLTTAPSEVPRRGRAPGAGKKKLEGTG
jgi:hypothetical protein